MATRFEIVMHGGDPARMRAAAEEAFDEIERLESQLSLFRPSSEISNVNSRAAIEPVQVSLETFRLLERAAALTSATGGAFDITIAPLMRAWGFVNGPGTLPDPAELAAARRCVGMNLVQLDPANRSVRFARAGVMLDLGAIGKGYAVERAAESLRELGVTSALVHGGTSTACAIGAPPDSEAWTIAVEHPRSWTQRDATDIAPSLLAKVSLRDESLSMSAWWGKSFEANGRTYGHVMDPRSGEPTDNAVMALVVTESATESDALSTALLTIGPAGLDQIAAVRPASRSMVAAKTDDPERYRIESRGIPLVLNQG